MANAKIGSHPSYGYQLVETLDTTGKQLTPSDSGKLFMCVQNGTADVLVNLPQLSTDIAGWHAKFILKTNSSNNFIIMGYGMGASGHASDGDNDLINHREYVTDGNASTNTAESDGIQFAAAGTEVGTMIEIQTDGTSWYAQSFSTADANITAIDS
jgi:hypothetical protein